MKTSKGGLVQMSDQAKFNKEIQDRKKAFQDKKIELISRLCAEETTEERQKQRSVSRFRS
jgi:hypothetical protein